jgi:hypothetical protein
MKGTFSVSKPCGNKVEYTFDIYIHELLQYKLHHLGDFIDNLGRVVLIYQSSIMSIDCFHYNNTAFSPIAILLPHVVS